MLGEKVIIDTNIWASHALNYPEVVEYINELISNNTEFLMPTVVQMELLSHWEVETNPQVKAVKNHYIYDMTDKIVDVTSEIAQLAAQIRRKAKIESNKKIKGPDAMIAASAFIHNAKLISNNNKDFAWITFNFSYQGQPLSYVNPIKDTIAYASFIKSFQLPNLPDADNLQENEKES
ncbi:PIN domain-containing protein [Priestia megaterium]|uniref:PIN domain-containing protein n=1 Tax=Priestia megaterium TaxID=1404 RepID=UPI0024532194|nr:PIN domain-containing protein [Priestia megaterium]MDH3142586.1 PIN domain-containing protein [Priestia megaterium]MED4239884.1 PIN domain-containing protein [Priestia megaterium]MED4255318.1 PIN domain-containing protein [Priestia megaterium]MED4265336.1 PIN domain-containing protein [Priestia megaterium]MED4274660.1 PIN domain-containing protein [Priestia megaterium]